jgi:protocatechuate 3,4-dioxygenase, beta subunit
MVQLRMIRYSLSILLVLAYCMGISSLAYAGGNDPALDDKNRVETAEEAQAKKEQEGKTTDDTAKDTVKEFSLSENIQKILEQFPDQTPLRDAVAKVLSDLPHAKNEELYQKVKEVLKNFSDQKGTPLYDLLRNALREYKPIPYKLSLMPCQITPTLFPSYLPKKTINKNGNLLRKEGSARRARGKYTQVTGKVVDEECVPIENAVIEIWQTDQAGKHEDEYELKTEWDVKDPDYDKNFAYTGTVQTNNLGEFSFLTVFPGVTEGNQKQAPHLNIRVVLPGFEELKTRIYFAKHPKNDADRNLQSLAADSKTGQVDVRDRVIAEGEPIDPSHNYEGRMYRHTLVLKGIDPYRQY